MNSIIAAPNVILVRHAPVAAQFHGLCYGRSDVMLGADGERISFAVAEELKALKHAMIVHSGMQRTRFLAELLASQSGHAAVCVPALQERDFGDWEMQSWENIHARCGADMLRMITEPDTFRPGGGETTFEMRDRVMQWLDSAGDDGLTIAVTHGGPIAAMLGTQRRLPVSEWARLIPGCGEIVSIVGGWKMDTSVRQTLQNDGQECPSSIPMSKVL